jgi:ubiquilin
MRDNPMLQEMIRNPEMRRMLFNPEMMRMQLQMQRAMGNAGPRFTAPGATDNTPNSAAPGEGATANTNPASPAGNSDPLAGLFGNTGGAGANPFASLLGPGAFAPPQQNQNGSGANPSDSTQAPAGQTEGSTAPPPNPFGNLFGAPPTAGGGQQPSNPLAEMTRNLMQNPDAMRQAMNLMNSMNQGGANPFGMPPNPSAGAGAGNPPPNPFANLFGPGGFGGAGFGTPPPADNRPPEEQYETQLRQLNEMGFFDFDRNVQALIKCLPQRVHGRY